MIWHWIVAPLAVLLKWVFDALPTVDLSDAFRAAESVGRAAARECAKWNLVFPVRELFHILVIGFQVIGPAVLVYVAANWVWRHIPDLWGFGPGAG